MPRYSRCSAGELGVERELGHADDAVHRRADFVAHVGEKLALRAAPFLGPVSRRDELGVDRHELGGPRVDLFLQVRLMALQLCVAFLNLPEHLVEPVDQRADLVLAAAFDPDRVGLFARHRSRGRGEPKNRSGNESLKHPCDSKRNDGGAGEHERHDAAEMAHALPLLRAVRFEVDRADALVIQNDRTEHPDAIVRHRDRVVGAIARRSHRRRGEVCAVVGRERLAVEGVHVRVRDLGFVRQRFQRVAHGLRIVERHRRGAAGSKQVGQRLRILDLLIAEGNVVVGHEGCARDQQRNRHREHDDVDNFPANGKVTEKCHGLLVPWRVIASVSTRELTLSRDCSVASHPISNRKRLSAIRKLIMPPLSTNPSTSATVSTGPSLGRSVPRCRRLHLSGGRTLRALRWASPNRRTRTIATPLFTHASLGKAPASQNSAESQELFGKTACSGGGAHPRVRPRPFLLRGCAPAH